MLKGTWFNHTIASQNSFYTLTVDEKGELVSLGSPAGRDGDICDGSLTGKKKLKLVLDCLDTNDIKVGPAQEKRVYRAEVLVAEAAEVGVAGQGPTLVAQWEDGRIDYLTKS
ncbi:hypothetical protein [Streptomyces sp. PSKA30]|uniref:hypothetical protein n=1 Tax=Streptomyces sp. PSKA30 TaxID=2874597 RepID=UPI001CD17802|nr:hypothetical protein [Streptomyces sp. PSKA30]MBZ9637874.1 hypothetical protein [Streptomyces sp. PSKA30]